MTLINRYISKEFLKIFLLSSFTLVFLYFLIDFLGKLRIFLKFKAEPMAIFEHFLYLLPKFFYDTTPMAILFSTLITFRMLAKNNEITALKSAGVSPYSLTAPVLGTACLIGLILLYANTDVIPIGIKQAEFVRSVLIEKKSETSYFRQNKIWFRTDNHVLISVQMIDPDKKKFLGIGIYKLSDTFSLKEEIDARELSYENSNWYLLSGIQRIFSGEGKLQTVKFEKMKFDLDKTPEDFKQIGIDENRLKYNELRNYVRKLSAEGYPVTRYLVDLYGRVAFPVVNIIMAMIAISFGLNSDKRSGGISRGIGICMVIGFSYWLIYAMSISLGHNGMIPPVLSAWLANLLFMAIGGYLFLTIR
ncbi:MAG: LPS export ABC transporter permease LptG [Nitrospirae bacterium]|nr:LPS export ABC transporter permease LptG [Nitrospirota bacterium]